MRDAGLPDPPETLPLLEEGLHGLRLEVPVDRERLPQYGAVVVVVVAILALGMHGWLLLPALLVAWFVLADRRRTELGLDGDTLTLSSTTLGVLRDRRIALADVTEVQPLTDPPELMVRTSDEIVRIPWGGSATELGWLAAAVQHQVDTVREAGPVPPPPPELERMRRS